jgi:hypothetical protein
MEKAEQEKLFLVLLNMINQKKDEVKTLTCEIMELKNDQKNAPKIEQDIQKILNAVTFFQSETNDTEYFKLTAKAIFARIGLATGEDRDLEKSLHGVGLLRII